MQFGTPQQALDAIARAYYEERNLEAVLCCVTDDVEWIGTEEADRACGKPVLRELLTLDMAHFPSPYRVEMQQPTVQQINKDAVLITVIGLQKDIPGIDDGLPVRASLCCVNTENGWLFNHVHTSAPSLDKEKRALEKKLEIRDKRDRDRFRLVTDEMHAAVFEWDLKQGTFYHSAAYDQYAMSRVSTQDILNNRGPLDTVHPDDLGTLKQFFAESGSNKKRAECTIRAKLVTGEYRWCRMIGLYYYDEQGVPTHTIGVIIDVDSEHANSVKMTNLLNTVPAGIGVFDLDENGISQNYMNDAFYRMIGAKREDRTQYGGNNILATVHPKDIELIRQGLKQQLEGSKNSTELDYRIMGGDRNWVWLHLVSSVVERAPGKVKLHVAYYECTESKRQQLQLLQNQRAVALAEQQGNLSIWNFNIDKGIITQQIMPNSVGHMGYPYEIFNVPACFLEAGDIHPEDEEKYASMYRRIASGEEAADEIFRLKNQGTGEFEWKHMYYRRMEDNEEGDRMAVGFSVVVNEQQKAIERYRTERKLREQMYASAIIYMEYNLTKSVYVGKNNLEERYRQESWECPNLEKYRENMSQNIEAAYLDEVTEKMYAGNLLKAFERGESKVTCDYRSKERPGKPSFWCRITAVMVKHPDTGDVMAFVYIENIEDNKDGHLAIENSMADGIESVAMIRLADGHTRLILDGGVRLREEAEHRFVYDDTFVEHSSHGVVPEEREFSRTAALLSTVKGELEKAEAYQYTVAVAPKNGKRARKLFRFRYLDDRKTILIMAVSDVTALYLEEQKQKKKLEEALAEANVANQAKTNFLSRVSHDMRTPLNGILGLTTLLKNSATDHDVLLDLDELEMSGKYLLSLINDTLDMSRIETGHLELHPIVYDGRRMLNNAIRLGRLSIQNRNIKFNVHIQDNPFTMLYVDVGRVEQIFMNVFGNAVKFTPDGGSIDFSMTNISVENGVITNKLVIADTGIGMSPEFLPHIFEAFSQADTSKTSTSQGTGLGMAITKQLIELMGGSISVESELGKGTAFTMILKLPMATDEQIEAWKKTQRVGAGSVSIEGKRVLLVEDHPLNAKIATRLLEAKGVRVEHAENGQRGVEMFRQSAENYYDAILMDIRMPVMDGIEATKAIRHIARADAHTVPIIAMTANAFADDIAQTRAAGMDAHLSKPIQPDILFSTLAEIMRVPQRLQKQRILVVDDVELNRAVIRACLEKDYEILEAKNGKQAMDILHETGGVDAVITDIQMPEMDGIELIRTIRSDKKYRHMVIIANTQYGDPKQEEMLLYLGANDFVYKPTTPSIVEIRVRNALKRI